MKKNKFQRTRESMAAARNALVIFIPIFLLLSFGFMIDMVSPWLWFILTGNLIFLGLGIFVWFSFNPATFYFSRIFEFLAYLMAYLGWIFIIIPFYWAPTETKLAFASWSVQAACFICGIILERLRINVETQQKNFRRFISITDKGYHLRGEAPDWIVYNRKFKPAILERLFKFIIGVFTIICLVLAVMGGGAATAILAVLKLTHTQLSPHHFGMVMLSIPALMGVGYFSTAIWTGRSSWKKTVGHLGTAIWPEDEGDHTCF